VLSLRWKRAGTHTARVRVRHRAVTWGNSVSAAASAAAADAAAAAVTAAAAAAAVSAARHQPAQLIPGRALLAALLFHARRR